MSYKSFVESYNIRKSIMVSCWCCVVLYSVVNNAETASKQDRQAYDHCKNEMNNCCEVHAW